MSEPRITGPPIRVFLVATSQLAEEAVGRLLDSLPSVALAGSARDIEEARKRLETLAVDVVLVDPADRAGGPDEEGIAETLAWIRELADCRRDLKVLPLGLGGERQALSFLEAGAAGCTLRSDSADRVMAAIEGAVSGRAACAPRLMALVFARLAELSRRRAGDLPAAAELSRRERQVLALVARGMRNKEIARRLGIALSTASNHVQRVLAKLGAHRRRDAVRQALRRGLLDGSPLAAAGA